MRREEWRAVAGASMYEVSSLGRVRSLRSEGLVMTANPNTSGYLSVPIRFDDGKPRTKAVHRLVGEAFLGPLPSGLMTRHLDGDKTNNRVENLLYGTASENQQDSVRHGTCRPALVVECPQGHAYDEANTYLTPTGKRDCRTCRRDAARRYRARGSERAA